MFTLCKEKQCEIKRADIQRKQGFNAVYQPLKICGYEQCSTSALWNWWEKSEMNELLMSQKLFYLFDAFPGFDDQFRNFL